MDIRQALPAKKYSDALKHSQTPQWKAKLVRAVQLIRQSAADPRINHKIKPAIMCGYGKDGMATILLLKLAGIDFTATMIDNKGDLPIHYLCIDEFCKKYPHDREVYTTEKRYHDYIYDLRNWGRKNGMLKKDGSLVDYWDLGELRDTLDWYVQDQFLFAYGKGAPDILNFCGHRGAEAMDRAFLFKRNGPFFREAIELKDGRAFSLWYCFPMHDWRDIDVWALLVTQGCPVSAIYSMNEIPQKGGKQQFPRTYWYSDPIIMNGFFYRWLSRYAPVQLKELNEMFPELPARMMKASQQKAKARSEEE